MDLKLTGNRLTIAHGDLVLVDGLEAIAQHVTARLGFFLGEWFLDRSLGVDYYGQVFVKNPEMPKIKDLMRSVILGTPGVDEFTTDLSIDLNNSTRTALVSFSANTVAGALVYDRELSL
jgi:hypothetical protein